MFYTLDPCVESSLVWSHSLGIPFIYLRRLDSDWDNALKLRHLPGSHTYAIFCSIYFLCKCACSPKSSVKIPIILLISVLFSRSSDLVHYSFEFPHSILNVFPAVAPLRSILWTFPAHILNSQYLAPKGFTLSKLIDCIFLAPKILEISSNSFSLYQIPNVSYKNKILDSFFIQNLVILRKT